MKRRTAIVALLLLCVGAGSWAESQPPFELTTLLKVVANPSEYDQKRIQAIGFLRIEFEGNAVFIHAEDYDNGITGNAIFLFLKDSQERAFRELNNKYVVIQGVFDSRNKGHGGIFSGVLRDISRCELWSDPETPRRKR